MSEEQRYQRLVDALDEDSRGDRRLATLSTADAGVLARGLHREAAVLSEKRLEQAAEQEATVACKQGCNACCRPAVIATEPEAIAVAEWLLRDENAEARARFEQAYPSWRQGLGERIDRMMELDDAGHDAGARAAFHDIQNANVMCAFNHEGACSIYPARPHVCRVLLVLDTADHCQLGASRGPTAMGFRPYEEHMQRAKPLLSSAHHKLRKFRPGPLCDSVHRLLRAPELLAPADGKARKVGRNEPCPCGSGKKHKRCCAR